MARGSGGRPDAPQKQGHGNQPISRRRVPCAILGWRRICSFEISIRSRRHVGPKAHGTRAAQGLEGGDFLRGRPSASTPLRQPFIPPESSQPQWGCTDMVHFAPDENTTRTLDGPRSEAALQCSWYRNALALPKLLHHICANEAFAVDIWAKMVYNPLTTSARRSTCAPCRISFNPGGSRAADTCCKGNNNCGTRKDKSHDSLVGR